MNNEDKKDYVMFKAIQSRVDAFLSAKAYDYSKVKIECLNLKISMKDFGKLAGVSQPYLSKIVCGVVKPTDKTHKKIMYTIELLKSQQNDKTT